MKRSSSSDISSDSKRYDFEAYSQYQHQNLRQQPQHSQQQLNIHQQQQIQAHQHLQQQQFQAQQQQQYQLQLAQQQQQQQHQQQYAANQQYYNQSPSYYPMNSVNFQQFGQPPSQSPMMFNSSPSWNFMSPPPQFFSPSPSAPPTPSLPPLPPPDIKPEKPPLPREPEPGGKAGGPHTSGSNIDKSSVTLKTQPTIGAIRVRGLNGINSGLFSPFNGHTPNGKGAIRGIQPNRGGGRRNPHFFPQTSVSSTGLQGLTEYNGFAHLIGDDQPAGPEKLTIYLNSTDTGRVQVNKKPKRKPMSTRYTRAKLWVREEAEAAIALEKEFNRMQKRPMLILKFPDPDLNKYIVKKYSTSIDTVHFQQPSTPRYCFVQLKEDSDVDKVIEAIRQIPFGTGKISAELKNQHMDDQPVTPEEIDPYTLYIGNLPTHISVRVVKQYFPNAQRIDIGYAQRMRYTRYAFIRYNTVSEAMDSYRKTVDALLDSRSLIVRFRRQKGNIGLPGETKLNAPSREGREILPDRVPKVLDTGLCREDHEEDDFAEGDLAHLEGEADDEEDDEGPEAEEVNIKGIVVNPVTVATTPTLTKPQVVSDLSTACNSESPTKTISPETNETTISDKSQQLATKDEQTTSVDTKTIPDKPIVFAKESTQIPKGLSITPKATAAPKQSIVKEPQKPRATDSDDSSDSQESIHYHIIDRKDKVLQEARELMRKSLENVRRARSESPVVIGSFPSVAASSDIKPDPDGSNDSCISSAINLLGSRVKEEQDEVKITDMEDPFQDDYDYDDLDGEPEEEDDEDWSSNADFNVAGPSWEDFRRSELSVREDKPDLENLVNAQSLIPSTPVEVIPIELEPKSEIFEDDDIFGDKNKKLSHQFSEKDTLHDMFAQLNSDPEMDDDDDDLFRM